MAKYYFTFGSSKNYPFQNGYIVVHGSSETEAVHLFRAKYPDREMGHLNCAFVYNEEEWDRATANHNMKKFGELSVNLISAEVQSCCLCGDEIDPRNQHDARPVMNGFCCEKCNYTVVVPERIREAAKQRYLH